MKAVVINRYGNTEVLESRDVTTPRPGRGEILVEVHAVGLNPADFKIRQGHLKEVFPVQFPHILGGDISGVVKELGLDAHDFKVGDAVFFSNPLDKNGGYAEYVAVDQTIVAKKPPSLSHVEAASLPVIGLTSIQALRDYSALTRGMSVLIHAGAGGVGSFAIQYAKVLGATVYTTASAAKAPYVKALGADYVIDYKTEDFESIAKNAGGMDVVLETLGGDNFAKSIAATKDGGKVPNIVNPPDHATEVTAKKRGIRAEFFLLNGNRADLEEISALVEERKVRPTVSTVLSFEEIKKGHEMLESGRTQGKIVVKLR